MDFRLDLTKIKNKEINTIYFIGYPSNTIPFITQAKELGIKSKIITGDSSTSEEVLNLEISEGVIALLPRMELSDEFINKIKSIPEYKNLEVSISAAYTYDAMYTVFKAMEKGGDLKEEISKIEFKGITNDKISFDENGDLKNTAYQAQIIQNGKLVAIN